MTTCLFTLNGKTPCCLIAAWIFLCIACHIKQTDTAFAQTLAAPQNVKVWPIPPNSLYGGVPSTLFRYDRYENLYFMPSTFDVQFDSVPGAWYYTMDVAEDSLFTRILPGLQQYTEQPPFDDCNKPTYIDLPQILLRSRYGTSNCTRPRLWRVVYLLQGKQYFARVRAWNAAGAGPYSAVVSHEAYWSKLVQNGFAPSEIRLVSMQVRRLTDTSVTFALFRRANVPVRARFNGDSSFAARGDSLTVTGLQRGTNNNISIIGGWDSLQIRIRPFSNDMARFGKIISYYEGPKTPTTPGSDTLYYAIPRARTLEAVEDSLRSLLRKNVMIDTVWFNTGGFITCLGLSGIPDEFCDTRDSAFPLARIKLKKPEVRMRSFGYQPGIVRATAGGYEFSAGIWRFSDESVYYRFDINGVVTSVKQAQDVSDKAALRVYPNPLHKSSDIQYILPIAGTVRVEIHDIVGRTVFSQPAEWRNAGEHEIPFDASGLAPGTYLVRCTISNGRSVQHLTAHYLVLP